MKSARRGEGQRMKGRASAERKPPADWTRLAWRWVLAPLKVWVPVALLALPFVFWASEDVWPIGVMLVLPAALFGSCAVLNRAQSVMAGSGFALCIAYFLGPPLLLVLLGEKLPERLMIVGGTACAAMVYVGFFGLFFVALKRTGPTREALTAYRWRRRRTAAGYLRLAAARGPEERQKALLAAADLAQQGNPSRAAEIAGFLVEANPEQASFWRARACFEWLSGAQTRSLEASETAIALCPEDAALRFERGVRRAQQSATREAAGDDLRQAVRLAPHRQDYAQALADLEAGKPLPLTLATPRDLFEEQPSAC